jgi:dienelactone hydrolase
MMMIRLSAARALATIGALLAAAGALVLLFAHPAAAQTAFVWTKGADTAIVERVSATGATIVSQVFQRGAPSIAFTAEVARDARGPAVPMLTYRVFGPGAGTDATPLQVGSMRISADSAIIEAGNGTGTPQRVGSAVSGWPIPLVNGSFVLTELMVERAKASTQRPFKSKFHVLAGAGIPLDVTVDFVGTDSAVLTIPGQEYRLKLNAQGRITGGTLASQGLTFSRVTGAAANAVSLGRPDYGAPAGAPYTSEEVTVKTPKGHSLTGTLTLPKGATGRVPAVVTITGSGQQDRDEYLSLVPNFRPMRQLADTLGRRGIAVLRMDDRGINGSGGDVSGTSADFADDIRAGIEFLRARTDIDGNRIGLFGHSEGGLIGPIVAATDSKLAGIVMFAGPAYTGRQIINFQLRNLVMGDSSIPAAKKDSTVKAQVAQWENGPGKQPWAKFFLDHDPIATLKQVKVPVLILQGGTDQQVTPDQAPIIERTLKESGNKDVTMRVFANRNHLFLPDSVGFPRDYAKIQNGRIGSDVMGPAADWLVLKLTSQTTRP